MLRLLSQNRVDDPIVEISASLIDLHIAESHSALALKLGWPFRRLLHQQIQIQRPDILHDHGLWLPSNHYAAEAARQYRIPLMIQPRGMLEPWAIQHKGGKKRLALALYQRRDLATARVLVATAEQEYVNLRALGLRQPIAIIPNGVPLPDSDAVLARPPRPAGAPRTVLFLGRVYPVKGLLNLIDAWARVRPTGWRLQIAGPDEAGHLVEVLARARQAGASEAVDYVGAVDGAAKSALYRSADLFVLPSFTENFGVVVA
ncbi:MAG TPA: glycosyltransferase, partial [Candidatus Competibacteraceae bacterium]|nr:glycosyltransferase [Candidatus Competibacteraceae bacterium]